MVLPLDLLQAIAQGLQKVLIGRDDGAVQIKLDGGVQSIDPIEHPLHILARDLLFGDLVADPQILLGLPGLLVYKGSNHRIHIVGGAILGAVLHHAPEDLPAPDRGPHLLEHFLGHVRMARGVVAEADQFVLGILGHLKELLVDVHDIALEVGLRDNARLVQNFTADLSLFAHLIEFQLLFRDVRGKLHHLVGFAIAIEQRIVRRLNPDFLASLGDALIGPRIVFAPIQLRPEGRILRAVHIGCVTKHPVVLPLDLRERVAQRLQEIVVRRDDGPIHIELDDCLHLVDRCQFRHQLVGMPCVHGSPSLVVLVVRVMLVCPDALRHHRRFGRLLVP